MDGNRDRDAGRSQEDSEQKRIEEIAGIVLRVMEEKDKKPEPKGWRKWVRFAASNWVLFAFCLSMAGAFLGWAFFGISPLQPLEEIKYRQDEYQREAKKAEYQAKMVQRHLTLGNELMDVGQLGEARTEFEKALEQDELSVEAQAGLLKASVFDSESEEYDPELVERRLELLLEDNPGDPHLHYFWGDLYRMRDPEQALDYYRKAIELDSTVAAAWYGIGVIRDMQQQTEEAIRMYEKALGLSKWNQTYLNNLGYQYYRTGRFEEAKELYERVINLDAGYLLTHYTYAGSLMLTENFSGAYSWLKYLTGLLEDESLTELDRNQGMWFFHTDGGRVEFYDWNMKRCYAYYSMAFASNLFGRIGEAEDYIDQARDQRASRERQIIDLVRYDADRLLERRPDLESLADRFFDELVDLETR